MTQSCQRKCSYAETQGAERHPRPFNTVAPRCTTASMAKRCDLRIAGCNLQHHFAHLHRHRWHVDAMHAHAHNPQPSTRWGYSMYSIKHESYIVVCGPSLRWCSRSRQSKAHGCALKLCQRRASEGPTPGQERLHLARPPTTSTKTPSEGAFVHTNRSIHCEALVSYILYTSIVRIVFSSFFSLFRPRSAAGPPCSRPCPWA